MNQNVRIALIAGLTSIITALIAAGATLMATEKARAVEDKERSKEVVQTAESSEVASAAAQEPGYVSLTATVTSDGKASMKQEGPVKADICVLTGVGSYGGATKGCTLTREVNGWVLVANARKSTAVCQATCFNLRPGPNGPPSP